MKVYIKTYTESMMVQKHTTESKETDALIL